MTGSRSGTEAAPSDEATVLRFDGVQRVAHWSTAVLFGVLVASALPLGFGSVERVVGRHVLFADLHLWTGIAFPVPLAVSAAGPWGRRLREDMRRIDRWAAEEIRWLRSWGGVPLRGDKFNPAQKLLAVVLSGALTLLFTTGILMRWFGLVPVSWRTGATFVHELMAWLAVALIAGHVAMALTHREALVSMVRGRVSRGWAQRHAPAWLAEQDPGEGPGDEGLGAEREAPVGGSAGGP